MRLTVKLFAYFRENRFIAEVREYSDKTQVGDIITDLGIDLEEIGVIMINSKHCRFDSVPQDDDILAIFPIIGGG